MPAHVLPQLADTAEVVRFAKTLPGLTVAVLVPNLRGAEAAIAAGADKITLPVSMSETHSLRNVRRTRAQMVEEARAIAAADRRPACRSERPGLRGRPLHRLRLHAGGRHPGRRVGPAGRGADGGRL